MDYTSIHEEYLKMKKLKVKKIDGGVAWLDTGTFDSMMKASQFVQVVQDRQGVMVGCIEEVAYKMGFIDKKQINKLAEGLLKSGYGKYLLELQK
jgi:glucose-1-phosphate thymidylyltransferase